VHHTPSALSSCGVRRAESVETRERGVRAVVALTFVMMLLEIGVGYATRSMALLADGWHMATHVAALGLASAAYALSRRFANHRAFAFGTGKIHALAGYTSAVALGLVALVMVGQGVSRLLHPEVIDFGSSLPVAIIGLVVNLVSFRLLHGGSSEGSAAQARVHGADHPAHGHDHDHDDPEHDHDGGEHDHELHDLPGHAHGHHHDHNHRAALLHVAADALTSVLAIVALLAGRFAGYTWLDPAMGIVGGVVILKWGANLCKHAAFDLLDVELSPRLEQGIRSALESIDDVVVSDLHVWSLGRGARGCIVTIISSVPHDPAHYRRQLAPFGLAHLTVEVQRCEHGHAPASPALGGGLQPAAGHG
jgi:cation diffusion facilitator family transporter